MRHGPPARGGGAAFEPRRARSPAWFLALALALLLAQSLGLLHGVAHPHAGSAPVLRQLAGVDPVLATGHASGASQAASGDQAASVADHEDGSALCRLVDHLAHADVLPAAVQPVVVEKSPAERPVATPQGVAGRAPSPYEARGPPANALS